MKRALSAFAVGLVLLLAGCSSPGTTPVATPETSSTSATAAAVTSSADMGTVTGRLSMTMGTEPANLGQLPVYLGKILKSSLGKDSLVELDKDVAPKAEPDGQGNFTFVNVPPGRYGLMLDTPRGPVLLNDQATGGDFIIEVQAGQTNDLGDLTYNIGSDT